MYKLLIVLWDNSPRYSNISDDLKDQMLTATRTSLNNVFGEWKIKDTNFLIPEENFIITTDLNDIIYETHDFDYTHVVVASNGLIFQEIWDFLIGLRDHFKENPKLIGHILHHGIKDNNNFFTLHDQMFVMSKELINSLDDNDFVFNNSLSYKTDKWIPIARTSENVHDDYTPLRIWKDNTTNDYLSIEKDCDDGVGEDLIQHVISKNWEVHNFNADVRRCKIYSYYHENPHNFEKYTQASFDIVEQNKDNLSEVHYDFLKNMKEYVKIGGHKKWYAYNNEPIDKAMPDDEYDLFVGVASGLLPWHYLTHYNFSQSSKVLLIDINDIAIDFQRWFLKNYDVSKDYTWQDWVEQYEKTNSNVQESWSKKFIDQNNKVWKNIKPLIDSKWNQIKRYRFEFVCASMIGNQDISILYSYLKSSKRPMIWMSNIFTFDGVCFANNKPFEKFLADIFSSNQLVSWTGNTPYGSKEFSNGPNSEIITVDDYCEKINVPDFDTDQFLNEIENLEKNNLFVKHRGNKHPGWSSFVLHGIGWNKTNDYGDYGYNSNEETPYQFTSEAIEHTPSIVDYFKNNKIEYENYYRIRIMKLDPDGYISIHNDIPDGQYHTDGWNLNMAINNPKNCEMHFWNDKYIYLGQVPWQPGNAFRIRTGYNHMVRNLSKENRYHIIVHGK